MIRETKKKFFRARRGQIKWWNVERSIVGEVEKRKPKEKIVLLEEMGRA